MKLVIDKQSRYADVVFLRWLVSEIQHLLAVSISSEKISMLEEKYKDLPVFSIFQEAIENIDVFESAYTYYICVDTKVTFPRTSYNLAQLCRTVNYGSLDVTSYPVFTKVFSSVAEAISSYYNEFLEEDVF